MSSEPTIPANSEDVRRRVAACLALISSRRAHEILERRMTPERVAYELLRCWIESAYAPGMRCMDGLRADFDAPSARIFEAAFHDDELAAMARFQRFAELRLDRVSSESLRSGLLPIDDRWQQIVRDAGYLLDELEADPSWHRARIEAVLETGVAPDDMIDLAPQLYDVSRNGGRPSR